MAPRPGSSAYDAARERRAASAYRGMPILRGLERRRDGSSLGRVPPDRATELDAGACVDPSRAHRRGTRSAGRDLTASLSAITIMMGEGFWEQQALLRSGRASGSCPRASSLCRSIRESSCRRATASFATSPKEASASSPIGCSGKDKGSGSVFASRMNETSSTRRAGSAGIAPEVHKPVKKCRRRPESSSA